MKDKNMDSISVIGAGAWGTALAQIIANKNMPVFLWTRSETHAQDINTSRENKTYLASIPLSANITATSNLQTALNSNILLIVTPAQSLRSILGQMKPYIRPAHVLVLGSKGIELGTEMMMAEVVAQILPQTTSAVLTGPNFAHEIAAGKPAATTLACKDEKIAGTLQNVIATSRFRPYITNDVTGVQIAGALKNVIAIACGIAHGLNMGESARASLVTRGMAEIARLGCAMGARHETFLGLSGMGDMMLTCSSEKSRNFSLGLALGRGDTMDNILKNRRNVTEGVHTAKAAVDLAARYKVTVPVCETVHKCLNLGLSLDEALQEMLNRPLGHEF